MEINDDIQENCSFMSQQNDDDFERVPNFIDTKTGEIIWSWSKIINLISDIDWFNADNGQKKSEERFEYTQNNIISNHQLINQNSIKPIPLKNKNIKSKFTTTTFLTKKRGRKENGSNEKGNHNKDAEDNQTRKNWRLFIKSILDLFNSISLNEKIKLTNFIEQFGSSINKNTEFLGKTFYEYFTYNTVDNVNKGHKKKKNNKDSKPDKKTGDKNLEIINKMLNDPVYKAIMHSTIESIFQKFIENEKSIIINEKKYTLENFKTINDIIKEQENQLKKENKLNLSQINEKLNVNKNKLKNLVNYIKVTGPTIKRK